MEISIGAIIKWNVGNRIDIAFKGLVVKSRSILVTSLALLFISCSSNTSGSRNINVNEIGSDTDPNSLFNGKRPERLVLLSQGP
ncbi:MAG: hypothetical protein MI975_25470 [Cytophagales bacterium]|nr:hypothetical protein [Cytophagales bacterium]